MFLWCVPGPTEAIIISGSKRNGSDGPHLRVVTGKGCVVNPFTQVARKLSLDLREAQISEPCLTKQGIRMSVEAAAVFKVGDDDQSIADAARRFGDQQDYMQSLVGQVMAGHLRSIVGALTVEEIISGRDRLARQVKDSCARELQQLGLVLDSLQIKGISDDAGYIEALAQPHVAVARRDARIAAAQAEQAAAEQEQLSQARQADVARQVEVQKACYQAEIDRAQAQAAQAGPLAQAQASHQVIAAETGRAELQAVLTARQLASTVHAHADAEAYKIRTLAQADRDAMSWRAQGLGRGNQALLAANQIVDQLPALVAAAAQGLADSNLVVLNGTDGVNQVLTAIAGQAFTIYETLRAGVDTVKDAPMSPAPTNGHRPYRTSVQPRPIRTVAP
jgi:flotillin